MVKTIGNISKAIMPQQYKPEAIYQTDSDCIEYIRQDGGIYYDRIDDFLTLIKTIDSDETVGFKLKGFKYILQNKPDDVQLNDVEFKVVVRIFEIIFTSFGNELITSREVREAYDEAVTIAVNDNVKITDNLNEILNAA